MKIFDGKEFFFIPGYNEKYLVSRYGSVLSVKGRTPRIIKPWNDRGYFKVIIAKEKNKYINIGIHRLMAKIKDVYGIA